MKQNAKQIQVMRLQLYMTFLEVFIHSFLVFEEVFGDIAQCDGMQATLRLLF